MTFTAATDGTYVCANYCVDFDSSDPSVDVQFVNLSIVSTTSLDLKVTIGVNGVYYNGIGTPYIDPVTGQRSLLNVLVSDTTTGGNFTATIFYNHTSRIVNSGRAHYTITHNYATGGTLTFP